MNRPAVQRIFSPLVVFILGCSGPSSEQIANYSSECVKFYKENSADRSEHVEYRRHWMKDGRLVVSLAVKKREGDSTYIERLCVIDFEDKTMQIPGIFNQGRWEK